jgi:hypothetical protein
MFVAFFLANIASRYAKDFIDKKLRIGNIKDKHDIKLANNIINLIDRQKLDSIVYFIGSGTLPRDLNKEMVDLIHLGENDEFYDRITQNQFIDFHSKIIKLKKFCSIEFSPSGGKNSDFEMHRYHSATDGNELYQKNIKIRDKILDEVEKSYFDLEEILRDKYPSVFICE